MANKKPTVTEEEINKLLKKIFKIVGGSTIEDLAKYLAEGSRNNYSNLTDEERNLIPALKAMNAVYEPDHLFLKDDLTTDAWGVLDSTMHIIYQSRVKGKVSNLDFDTWYKNILEKNTDYFEHIFSSYKVIDVIGFDGTPWFDKNYPFDQEFGMIIDLDVNTFTQKLIKEWKNLDQSEDGIDDFVNNDDAKVAPGV